MKKVINPLPELWPEICQRPVMDTSEIEKLVSPIFKEIREKGDEAVLAYTSKFDKVSLDELKVSNSPNKYYFKPFLSLAEEEISAVQIKAGTEHRKKLSGMFRTLLDISRCWCLFQAI